MKKKERNTVFSTAPSNNRILQDTGNLGDIAPTMLDLLGEEKPVGMTGRSMIKEYK